MKYLFSILLLFPAVSSFGQSPDWPVFRGKADLTGKSDWILPEKPSLLWSWSSGSSTKSSPVISYGLICFGTDKGSLIALSSDGKLAWKTDAGSPVESPPMIYKNNVIYSTADGNLYSADRNSGRKNWSYHTDNQIAGSANWWTNGTTDRIIVGSYDYFLHCVNPLNGKMVWRVATENYINGTPAVSGNRVIFGGCDGMIRIVDPASGKVKDTIEIGTYIAASPAISGNMAWFGDYDGNFFCTDLNTGKVIWHTEAGPDGGSIQSVPAVTTGIVIISSDNGFLYCYNSSDGRLRWKFRANGGIKGSAVVSGDKVLFGSDDGFIYIVGLNDGLKKWSFKTGSPVISSPAVTRDRFYILTSDGRLLAFGKK